MRDQIKDEDESYNIRTKTLTTFLVLGCSMWYFRGIASYYHHKKIARERVIDIFEMFTMALVTYTAMVEFIGITNIADGETKLDNFISSSYSSEWYYISSLAYGQFLQMSRFNKKYYRKSIGRALNMVLFFINSSSVEQYLRATIDYSKVTYVKVVDLMINIFGGRINNNMLINLSKRFITDGTSAFIKNDIIPYHESLSPDVAKDMRSRMRHNHEFNSMLLDKYMYK